MDVFVLSQSSSFERSLSVSIPKHCVLHWQHSMNNVVFAPGTGSRIVMIHTPSFPDGMTDLFEKVASYPQTTIAVASDLPNLEQMLSLSRYGISAYFNSYMADTHYHQMLRLLEAGQSWFSPDLLQRAFELARRSSAVPPVEAILAQLTPRERDIALAVRQGMSNRRIAASLGIKERTVKSHLTHIFEKLGIKDRVALAIRVNVQPDQLVHEG